MQLVERYNNEGGLLFIAQKDSLETQVHGDIDFLFSLPKPAELTLYNEHIKTGNEAAIYYPLRSLKAAPKTT